MSCAACRQPLRRIAAVLAVRAWICERCRSVAAEMASLAASVPRERILTLEDLGEAPDGDRGCPKCGHVMQRGPVHGGFGSIDVDACRPCRIAWFDKGELQNLQTAMTTDPPAAMSKLSPAERSAWKFRRLREEARLEDEDFKAAMLGLVLRVPLPEPFLGQVRPALTTWGIAALVAATSIAAFATGVLATARRFGLIPADLSITHAYPLLTHFFVHADPFHLLGNLAYLVMFGSRVEALVGRVRLVSIILVATLVGGLAHAAVAPNPSVPLIGASGGISGVLAAYVALRPRSHIRWRIWAGVVRVPAYGFFVFWILLQLIGVAEQVSGVSAVSALGHLGGAAAGFAIGAMIRMRAERDLSPLTQCR
jgi:membrane associated rhomboid family serine protease